MLKKSIKFQYIFATAAILGFASCEKDEETLPDLRTKIDYAKVTATTPYKSLFVSASGDSTVDLKSGNDRYKIFQALNYYLGAALRDGKTLDATLMKNMFANSGSPFTDIASLKIVGAELNASGVQLRNLTASSKTTADAEAARVRIETLFGNMVTISNSVSATASKGVAGKLGTYLVDAKGIETAQIIQKSLIGALQLDYIGNV